VSFTPVSGFCNSLTHHFIYLFFKSEDFKEPRLPAHSWCSHSPVFQKNELPSLPASCGMALGLHPRAERRCRGSTLCQRSDAQQAALSRQVWQVPSDLWHRVSLWIWLSC